MNGVSSGKPGSEVDVWWGSYSGRTMVPGFVLSGALTMATIAGGWYLWAEFDVSPLAARYGAYSVIGLIWCNLLMRWGYRILVLNYRLTTRRLFIERAFLHTPFTQVELHEVARVQVECSTFERRLDVGRLLLVGEQNHAPLAVMEGVYQPERIAEEIRQIASRLKPQG
jgi:hypothetical protein